jgi:hypothetical protein
VATLTFGSSPTVIAPDRINERVDMEELADKDVRVFGNRGEKAAREEAAGAEAQRLMALPVADFAAELMRAFGAGGPGRGSRHEVNLI